MGFNSYFTLIAIKESLFINELHKASSLRDTDFFKERHPRCVLSIYVCKIIKLYSHTQLSIYY
jgi:hypothetical protein